jgi:putative transcriptional regulator
LEQRGLSIYELARRSDLPYQTVHRIARETTSRINLATLAALCDALDCQPGDIVVYEPPER